jgi:hypothetical protein
MSLCGQIISFASTLRSDSCLELANRLLRVGSSRERSRLFRVAFGELASKRSILIAAEIASSYRIESSDFVGAALKHAKSLKGGGSLAQGTASCVRSLNELERVGVKSSGFASQEVLKYTECMLNARYAEAYRVWATLPEVRAATYFEHVSPSTVELVDLGLVLPGTAVD